MHSIVLALFLHYRTMFNRAFAYCYIRKYVFEVAFRIFVPGDRRSGPGTARNKGLNYAYKPERGGRCR